MSLRSAFDTPDTKRRYVARLFATIANRYDLVTVLLSWGRDQAWKRRLVRETGVAAEQRAVDLACGTGDIAFALAARGARVVGLDLTHRMIELARLRASREDPGHAARFLTGDMMALPFADRSVDLVTVGYGLRNVPSLESAVGEIARVLRPGGRLASLDFNRPDWAPLRAAYLGYLTLVGSALGWVLHGDPDTYRYIPESIRRYPGAHAVARLLERHGFTGVRLVPLLGGLMTLHVADRPRSNPVEPVDPR